MLGLRQLLSRARRGLRRNASRTTTDLNPKYEVYLRNVEACLGPLNKKRILEVGSDPTGRFLDFLTRSRRINDAVGINPSIQNERTSERYQLRSTDVREMPFSENEFDLILSISVFEHIQQFDRALAEMYRVLRPGGHLITEFGPIWSGCWGHHLWMDYDGRNVNWRNTPLPPYAHLTMSKDEVIRWCTEQYGDKGLSEAISRYVFDSGEQNRLMFTDYEQIVRESEFETLFFVGHPDVPFRVGYETSRSTALFTELKRRFPNEHGFGYHLISMLLTK